jgi:hypothetical protein
VRQARADRGERRRIQRRGDRARLQEPARGRALLPRPEDNLKLRPVFHRLEHRIRAHVVICWLALLLIRIAERTSGRAGGGSQSSCNGCTPSCSKAPPAPSSKPPSRPTPRCAILVALEIEPSPRITALEPA